MICPLPNEKKPKSIRFIQIRVHTRLKFIRINRIHRIEKTHAARPGAGLEIILSWLKRIERITKDLRKFKRQKSRFESFIVVSVFFFFWVGFSFLVVCSSIRRFHSIQSNALLYLIVNPTEIFILLGLLSWSLLFFHSKYVVRVCFITK